ncbi:MAG: hypothetical protein ABI986_06610, partial [Chloroflexota bacterium]
EAPVATSISVPVTETSEVVPQATETSASVVVVADTATIEPTATEPPAAPKLPAFGGADQIALVANNELYTMNVDGTDLKGPLTADGATKSDLQWLADGKTILFISGKTIKFYDVTTDTVDTLATFPSEVSVDAFQVSHDNKQVMIALSHEIFVVPFDMSILKTVTNRNQLPKLKGACLIDHTPKTLAVTQVRDARWSVDDKLVAWLFRGNDSANSSTSAEQVSVLDITACKPELIKQQDNFPGIRFTPVGYQNREMPDFDWDGMDQFSFNMNRRNNGWGEFYIYNWKNHKGVQQMPTGTCCYRDARWSPNGTYLLFEYQDQAPDAQAVLYYVASGELGAGANFTPLPLPAGFFKNPKEGIQAALRPTQP